MSEICAADHITFLGTQPTLTQVPPRRARSMHRTRLPWEADRLAQAIPVSGHYIIDKDVVLLFD